jgi:hypothetical protein
MKPPFVDIGARLNIKGESWIVSKTADASDAIEIKIGPWSAAR